ncbi:hypothetical protein [Thauera sinica]|uniref:Uncharacterized protein n=1 Tax=Thauera sinica TaxID=2665146 RepID=A0ABW1AV87_9RHOO|nr:hypothetical protein [Thauera sp. K11]
MPIAYTFASFDGRLIVPNWIIPLGQWLTGQRHIDLSGVWPGRTGCIEREAR